MHTAKTQKLNTFDTVLHVCVLVVVLQCGTCTCCTHFAQIEHSVCDMCVVGGTAVCNKCDNILHCVTGVFLVGGE